MDTLQENAPHVANVEMGGSTWVPAMNVSRILHSYSTPQEQKVLGWSCDNSRGSSCVYVCAHTRARTRTVLGMEPSTPYMLGKFSTTHEPHENTY